MKYSSELRWLWACLCLVLAASCDSKEASSIETRPFVRDTGGLLSTEQAAFDVLHYDLALQVFPDQREIAAVLRVRFVAVAPLANLVLDLDPKLSVTGVANVGSLANLAYGGSGASGADADGQDLSFLHQRGQIRIQLAETLEPGQQAEVAVHYQGSPRVAPNPPWEGGFQWAHTPNGAHWIATSCQMEGADLWWPCKDHPSDKAESFDLHIRVPEPLICASNGKLLRVEKHDDQTQTFHWRVSTPIANYAVALNIAPYQTVVADYQSVSGMAMPVTFWVLPEHLAQGQKIMPQFIEHLQYFENLLGPYPFRGDKYGIVETPHMGMEHQTIIAYGNQFRPFKWDFDWLHHHELAHEWFANLITAPDWNDFWIHEGFASYLQKLYVEDHLGYDAYREYLADVRGLILNAKAVAPRMPRSSAQMYFVSMDDPEGQRRSDSDIYYKGEWILHSLRWLVGKDAVLRSLRKMCYPDVAAEQSIDGSAAHFFTTDDYQALIEAESGMALDWFFELYLRQPVLPELVVEQTENLLKLHWKVPAGLVCEMPVEIVVGGMPQRVDMPGGTSEIKQNSGLDLEIDPLDRVLRLHNQSLR
jgi:aminopeptidase N